MTTCGDITVFKIDSTTGRLSLVVNAQVTAANGQPLNYFPVPANPVDFVLSGSTLLTLTGAPDSNLVPVHRRDLGLAIQLRQHTGS